MKTIGIFEAKTKLSEICDEAARTHAPVTITRRGAALGCIEPIKERKWSIIESREATTSAHGAVEIDDASDFEPAARSWEKPTFGIEE